MPIDYRLYPENWLTEIRPHILERATHREHGEDVPRCEFCGIMNYSLRPRFDTAVTRWTKVVLTIAHLDQDIQNNTDMNLAPL